MITTGQAFTLMEGGEELEARSGRGRWFRYRIHEGELQFLHNGTWTQELGGYCAFSSAEWRHVPAVPSVTELAEKWRAQDWIRAACADELDAARAADELVSLRGVDVQDLCKVWWACDGGTEASMQAVLDYLRTKAVKP